MPLQQPMTHGLNSMQCIVVKNQMLDASALSCQFDKRQNKFPGEIKSNSLLMESCRVLWYLAHGCNQHGSIEHLWGALVSLNGHSTAHEVVIQEEREMPPLGFL